MNETIKEDDTYIVNEETGEVQWVPIEGSIDIDKANKVLQDENKVEKVSEIVKNDDIFDKEIDEMEKQLGIKFNREELREKSREDILDFIESHNTYNDFTKEEIEKMVDNIISSVKVPSLIEQRDEINDELGLSAEDLKSLYQYLSGKGDKPNFLDRYLADNDNKLKDFQQVMMLLRLSQIPQLASLQAAVQQRLYSPEHLLAMDVKDLSTASANLSREMSDILNSAIKTTELLNSTGRVDSRYRALMDKLLVVPDDVLTQVEHLLNNR